MKTVAVLRGGAGGEHGASVKTGASILGSLKDRHRPIDVFIDRSGVWYRGGVPVEPVRALSGIDVAVNALHGRYGEGGEIQRTLERIGILYTGSGAYASAAALNHAFTKEMLAAHGVKVPRHVTLAVSSNLEHEAREAFRMFSPPVLIKPATSGASVGVSLAKTFSEFWEGVKRAFSEFPKVIVEEFIAGSEAAAGVVANLRGEPAYALMPVSLAENFMFAPHERRELERLARLVHSVVGFRQYSRSDFIVNPRGIYFVKAQALPELTDGTPLSRSLASVGISFDEFVDHIIETAMLKP